MIFGKLVERLAKGPFMKDVLKIFREYISLKPRQQSEFLATASSASY